MNDKSAEATIFESRSGRLLAGWVSHIFQMLVSVAQQVALVPIFLHYWTSDVLAAWLVLYAVGNLIFVADCGLHAHAINQFLAIRSAADSHRHTARFFAAMMKLYLSGAATIAMLIVVASWLFVPSAMLGFPNIAQFDLAFLAMSAGLLITLPSNLISALYRARSRYSRLVWLQCFASILTQVCQIGAIALTQSLLIVATIYMVAQIFVLICLLIDARRLFPFLKRTRVPLSMSWSLDQIRKAAPYGVANATELALLNLPVILVSTIVTDRVAVAQWGLTRVVAGLLRMLCAQATLPLAAELGHDYAAGRTESLRSLYARSSMLVTLLASVTASGLMAFWHDFFAIWTHDSVPYDPVLSAILIIGTSAIAPSLLALSFANYSGRGQLLLRVKGLQLAVFLLLSAILIHPLGPMGAAIAIIASDLLVQFGWLGLTLLRQTLQRPYWHLAALLTAMTIVILGGWALGAGTTQLVPGNGFLSLLLQCLVWLMIAALFAIPLAKRTLRERLVALVPS